MSTQLGFMGQLIVPARNLGVATVVKGQIVKHDHTAAIAYDGGLTGNPVFEVVRVDSDDDLTGEGGQALGVVMEDIEPNKTGRICVWGLVQALSATTLSVGDVVTTDSLGVFQNAAGGSHESPSGIAKEAVAAGEVLTTLKWFFVDFIASSSHGIHSAGDEFYGQGY